MKRAQARETGTSSRWPLGGVTDDSAWRRDAVIALVLVALAAGSVFLKLALWERPLLFAVAVGGLSRLVLGGRARRARNAPRGWVTVDPTGITRTDAKGSTMLAAWTRPFGVTILTNPSRTRGLIAFTTPDATRYVTVAALGADDAPLARDLFSRGAMVPDSDALGAARDDGASLRVRDGVALLRSISDHASPALQHIYLSGSHGEAIVLEGTELRVGASVFDLTSPLEWRGFMFHESVGQVATIYQATWVRQAGAELVLVAPMPAEMTSPHDADLRTRRDLKLLQSTPDAPPPRELRRAVERLFMLPLRQALDRAPKAPRQSLPPEHTIPAGRI
ncbi:MAG: hypothetical protein ABIP39_02695 [Polyangiaceae bacterium]